MAKLYMVMKDGARIKALKSLDSAKEIADKENAKVWYDGKCVYEPTAHSEGVSFPIEKTAPNKDASPTIIASDAMITTSSYRLKSPMNVRENPSLDAVVITTLQAGTIVEVYDIVNDWMKVILQGKIVYILFRNEEETFAEKI